ncbi:recombinase family protein [Streptomyces sp. NPDC059980]|uniref:recombinase family protein n=1 Tax=Streptomyces sp. NPDC059980 TaxID=3347022 RepID=UPI0036C24396
MNSLAGQTGREYLRVSARGERSIPEQHDDNTRAAEREGVTLAEAYSDQGSASRYAQRSRDDFGRLMDDLKNGQFGADFLWLWENSRGSRKVGEWVTLIELCEEQGVKVYVTTHGRAYDPADPRDRRSLLEDAVDSEYESAKISKRTRRGMDANVRAGKPHGICPFGFQRDYEIRRGKQMPVRQYAHPEHAPLIKELFERVWAEDSFSAIASDWERRGIVSRDRVVKGEMRPGIPFSGQTLRSMVTNVAYIGLRMNKGTTVKAVWEPLVTEELFYNVQTLISDPSRVSGNPGAAQYALTGAVPCDACGGPITVRYRPTSDATYECKKGCWRVSKADVDAYLIGNAEHPGVILAYLAREDVYEELDAESDNSEMEAIRTELAKARAGLLETEQAEPETLEEERRFARRAERLKATISELVQRQNEFVRPTKLRELFAPGPDVADRWEATPVTAQRAIAAMLLAPGVLGQPRVRRAVDAPAESIVDRISWSRIAG